MTMKTFHMVCKSALLLWVMAMGVLSVYANDNLDTELTKTITKNYAVNAKAKIEIINKYGQLIIEPWDKDSVAMKITVTTYGKNESAVEKLMDRIDFDFRSSSDFVKAETVLDKRSSPISEFFNALTDQSKAIFSKSHIEVNYEIKIPENANIDLKNRFGDVFLGKIKGLADLKIGHGDLKVDEFRGDVSLDLNFCHADIQYMQDADVILKGSSLDVMEVATIKINSISSEIDIENAKKIILNSKNDRIDIGKITQIEGEGHFSKLNIMDLSKSLELKLDYGSLKIHKIMNTFSEIDINSNSTDIKLDFQQPTYIAAELNTRADRINLPDKLTNLTKNFYDKDRFAEMEGFIGRESTKISKLKIKATSGNVRIRLLDEVGKSSKK